MINPYSATALSDEPVVSRATRRPRTYVDAALIGLATSLIAPAYFFFVWTILTRTLALSAFLELLTVYLPTAFCCVFLGVSVSALVPQRIAVLFSPWQRSIPLLINTVLFSLYFYLTGYGYIRGSIFAVVTTLEFKILIPGLIAGLAAFQHIALRPLPIVLPISDDESLLTASD